MTGDRSSPSPRSSPRIPDVPPGKGPLGAPLSSNVGMYRIQLAGGDYGGGEAGMHYQIHRGIGVHHTAAERRGEPLRVSIFVGGPPAHTLAAVMPLPEGLSELLFAGMLAGRRFAWKRRDDGFVVSADADFTITGWVDPGRTLPEGPFGDHLGYYSLTHPFPVLRVNSVTHRAGAVWPLTVVGRPPQEDTTFGQLIHEITEPMVPTTLPGVHSVHAVDAAGVHPLLLAVGSERYSPFTGRRPQELWTIANAILGFGQCSLAKYLFIAAREDAPELAAHDIPGMLDHVLRRVDLASDLHFQTRTTIDTLDYSGTGLNAGSKLVIAGAGPARRSPARTVPEGVGAALPAGFTGLRAVLPGVFVLGGPRFEAYDRVESDLAPLWSALDAAERAGADLSGMPLVILCDDPDFAAETLRNLLWVAFTRSNPSHDVHGRQAAIHHKHWSCVEPVLIDARPQASPRPPADRGPCGQPPGGRPRRSGRTAPRGDLSNRTRVRDSCSHEGRSSSSRSTAFSDSYLPGGDLRSCCGGTDTSTTQTEMRAFSRSESPCSSFCFTSSAFSGTQSPHLVGRHFSVSPNQNTR